MKIKILLIICAILMGSLSTQAQYNSKTKEPKKIDVKVRTELYGEGLPRYFEYYIVDSRGRRSNSGTFEVGEKLYLMPSNPTPEVKGYLKFTTSSYSTDKISNYIGKELYFDARMYDNNMRIPITVVDLSYKGTISITVKVYADEDNRRSLSRYIKYL